VGVSVVVHIAASEMKRAAVEDRYGVRVSRPERTLAARGPEPGRFERAAAPYLALCKPSLT
jgi:hypothetical protein